MELPFQWENRHKINKQIYNRRSGGDKSFNDTKPSEGTERDGKRGLSSVGCKGINFTSGKVRFEQSLV